MRKLLVTLAAAMLLLTACADGGTSASDNPKGALTEALRSLLESDAYTQTITVDSDTASLVALGDGDIDEAMAQKILDSSVTASGRMADNPADAASELLVNIAGSDVLEMRFVGGDLYLRVDVATLFETFGEDPSEISALTSQVRGQPGFEWVEPAVAGEWVVLEGALELSQQMGATTLTAEQQKQIVNDLLRSVEQNATVTDEGEDDDGAHVRAALPLKQTFEDLVGSLGSSAGLTGAALQDAMNDVPEGDVLIDFWITDGRVSQMAVDITQFEEMAAEAGEGFPEGVERLAITMQIEEFTGDVEAVSDAVPIDTAALGQAFSAFMGGASGSATPGGGSQFDCGMLKGAPPDVIELYAEECPELQG